MAAAAPTPLPLATAPALAPAPPATITLPSAAIVAMFDLSSGPLNGLSASVLSNMVRARNRFASSFRLRSFSFVSLYRFISICPYCLSSSVRGLIMRA
uniref:Putative secreted protein n=1 Tax=Anopheles darlingi TaxID=43151 RepID=A0A2M4DKJ3_ANODA